MGRCRRWSPFRITARTRQPWLGYRSSLSNNDAISRFPTLFRKEGADLLSQAGTVLIRAGWNKENKRLQSMWRFPPQSPMLPSIIFDSRRRNLANICHAALEEWERPRYNASKAFESIYREGTAKDRQDTLPITITEIPGFVDTAMARERDFLGGMPDEPQANLPALREKKKHVYIKNGRYCVLFSLHLKIYNRSTSHQSIKKVQHRAERSLWATHKLIPHRGNGWHYAQ